MFVVLVVILSSLVFSSAQPVPPPPADPSAECIAAYNATFDTQTNCGEAFTALLSGNASSQQKMMVCDANQQCNDMIENITNLCGNTVS